MASNKGLMLAGAAFIAAGALYAWIYHDGHKADEPQPVILSDEGGHAAGMPMDDVPLTGAVACPDAGEAVVLDFGDKPTPEVLAVSKAYELSAHNKDFIEEGDTHLFQFTDLNEDGREDFLTIYNAKNWCGSAGCLVEAYVQKEDGTYDVSEVTYSRPGNMAVLRPVDNGYHQITIANEKTAEPGQKQLWVWSEGRYVRIADCM